MKKLIYLLLLLSSAAWGQQVVNVGGSGGDHTGDPLRTAFIKLNANDADLYKLKLTPTTSVKTTNYVASAKDYVRCSTASGSFNITLPSAPADQTLVGAKMVTQGSTNTVTLVCGGTDVFNKTGGGTNYTLTTPNQAVIVQYIAADGIWLVIADNLSLAQLDLRFQPLDADLTTLATPGSSLKFPQVNGAGNGYQFVTLPTDPGTAIGDIPYVASITPNVYSKIAGAATLQALITGGVGSPFSVGKIAEGHQNLVDVTTWNVSTSLHGYVPKLGNDPTKFLNDQGVFAVPTAAASHPFTIPIYHGSNLTLTNQTNAEVELSSSPGFRTKYEATSLTTGNSIRIVVNVGVSSASANSPRTYIQYSTDESSWTTIGTGATTNTASFSATGVKVSAWIAYPSGAIADVFLRVMVHGGDGAADPAVRDVSIQIK